MSLLIDACYTWGTADHTTGTATSSSPHHRYHYHQHQQHALATTRHAPISQFTKRLTFSWARFWRIHTAVRTFSTNQNPDTPLRAASSPFAMNTNKPSCCSWNEILRILMTIDLHQSTSIMTQWNRTRSSYRWHAARRSVYFKIVPSYSRSPSHSTLHHWEWRV